MGQQSSGRKHKHLRQQLGDEQLGMERWFRLGNEQLVWKQLGMEWRFRLGNEQLGLEWRFWLGYECRFWME